MGYYTLLLAGLSALVLFAIGQLYRRKGSWSPNARIDPKHMPPCPVEPIKGREKYRVTMDVRKMKMENWLTVDGNYMAEHYVRRQLLAHEKSRVLQCLPESYGACLEMLEEVTEFLCQRFPGMFEKTEGAKGSIVGNKMTGETFVFGTGHDDLHPLETAARLTMEDLSILMKNADGEYYLYVNRLTGGQT